MGVLDVTPIPKLSPFHPDTRPHYLDSYWGLFQGRGWNPSQPATSGSTIGTATALGDAALLVVDGTQFIAPSVVAVLTGAAAPYLYQTFIVTSIAGNTLNVAPKVGQAFPIGAKVVPMWNNNTHPGLTDNYKVYAQFIADAKMADAPVGINLMGVAGDFETRYTDANGKTNCPIGWESVGLCTFTGGVGATYGANPHGRTNNSIRLTTTATGAGMRLLTPIEVLGGQNIVCTFNAKNQAGTAQLIIYDKAKIKDYTDGGTNSTNVVASASAALADIGGNIYGSGIPIGATVTGASPGVSWTISSPATLTAASVWITIARVGAVLASDLTIGVATTKQGALTYNSLATRTTLRFTVPQGVTQIEPRFTAGSTTGLDLYVDDGRAIYGRQDAGSRRYVIEDPGLQSIVFLGDSWGELAAAGAHLKSALEARFGRPINVINSCTTGQTLAQQNARFLADVLKYKPKYCIHVSGFANDITSSGANPQASMEATVDTFIDLCRANGIIPVIVGSAPINTESTISPLRNDQLRARCDVSVGRAA